VISNRIILISILFLSIFIVSANAQQVKPVETKKVEDTYFTDSNNDADMKILKAEQKPFTLSYGGWIESAIMDMRSGNDSATAITSSLSIAKIWLKAALPLNSYIYLRGRDIFTYYIDKPEGMDIDTTQNEPDVDAAYYSISAMDNALRISFGRKFYILGAGLIFNGRGDGGEIDLFTSFFDVTIFGAYTGLLNKDTNPYRLSTSDINDKGERIFAGGELSKSIANQTLYALALLQMDKNDTDTTYDSRYFGLGLKGTVNDALYYGEFIYEQGTSYISIDEKKDISAMAAIVGFNYFFNVKAKPVLLLDYAYGSGDPDRSSANSPTGNISKDDEGFMYFGTFVGGYALRPYLSNLHIYRAGFAVTPFDSSNNIHLKRINLTAKYSYYRKENSSPVNSGEADNTNKSVGQGADLSLKWKAFSDLSFYLNYGLFFPGAAYQEGEKTRSFTMAGVYLSF
jgi:hypothetical protein